MVTSTATASTPDQKPKRDHESNPELQPDAIFWRRMNSPSAADDLPAMAAVPAAPCIPQIELLLASPSGKPLLHLSYGDKPGAAPTPRPPAALSTLSAALVAFQHTTHHRTHTIRTAAGLLISLRADALHVTVSSADPHTSAPFLRALARLALYAVHSRLSAAFAPFLRDAPGTHATHLLAPVSRLLRAAVLDAVTHPLPYALLTPLALPSPTRPSSRAAIAGVLRAALLRWRDVVTHAVVFTASPPFPRRVVATAAPANRELSPMDVLLLMNVAPMRPDADLVLPERLYLQADDFAVASTVALRPVQLRLDPDDYDKFKSAVGGAHWRPEWNSAGGDVVWILGVVRKGLDCDNLGDDFLDFVENAIDRASATRDLMVSMERPWTLSDMPLSIELALKEAVKAVILMEQRRIIGTIGSFGHDVGVCILKSLVQWDREDMGVESPLSLRTKDALVSRFPSCGLFVVLWQRKFVVGFEDSAPVTDALRVVEKGFVPWMKRFRCSLVPEQDRATVPPQTPLAGLLSPFHS